MKIQTLKIILKQTGSLKCGNKLERWDTMSFTTLNLYQH